MAEKESRTSMDEVRDRLARNQGVVRPEIQDTRDQNEMFATHSRVADIEGHFGHIIRD